MSVYQDQSAFVERVLALPGLVGYWRHGAIPLTDSGPNSIPVTVVTAGAPTIVSGLLPFDTDGAFQITDAVDYRGVIPAGFMTGPWTITGLFRVAGTPSTTVRLMGWTHIAGVVLFYSTGVVQFNTGGGTVNAPGTFNDGRPHHFAASFSGTDLALAIDGAVVASAAVGATPPNAIGAQQIGLPNVGTFSGATVTLDELAVLDRAITPQEVSELWDAYNTPPDFGVAPLTYPRAVLTTPFLRHYWRLGGAGPWEDSVGGATATVAAGAPEPAPGLIAADDDGAMLVPMSTRAQIQAPITASLGDRWSQTCLLRSDGNANVGLLYWGGAGWNMNTANLIIDGQGVIRSWNYGAVGPSVNTGLPVAVALTYDGTLVRLYVDGVQVGSNMPGTWDTVLPIGTFSIGPASGQTAAGLLVLDEVALFSAALTADDVARLYQAVTQADLPEAPQDVRAEAGWRSATVSWEPPAWDGGAEVTEYVVEVVEEDA